MKRYRLVKDLPTFKAGDIFEISKNGNLIKREGCISDCIVAYDAQTLEKFPNILADWFEEIAEEPKTVWDLRYGDKCYLAYPENGYPVIREQMWVGSPMQEGARRYGGLFVTPDTANHYIERSRAEVVLRRNAKGFKPDWHGEGNLNCTWTIKWERHYIEYQDAQGRMRDKPVWELKVSHADDVYDQNIIYFPTKEDAEASINAHPDEWKTYLGVEE